MRAAIENIHHGDGKDIGRGVGGIFREIFVKRLACGGGSSACRGHRDGEDCVCAEIGFVGSAVGFDHAAVERALIGCVEASDGLGDFGVHVRDCFLHALAEIAGFVAIAKLDGFVFAGGGPGGHSGAAEGAAFEANVSFDCRIAARIENFAAVNGDDFGGHSALREKRDYRTS